MGEGLLLKYQLFQMSVDLKMLVFYLREYRVSLFYVSEDFIQGELFKITDTPWYNAWTQDKTFVYDNVIYAPFMAGDRHGVNNLHVAWVRSEMTGRPGQRRNGLQIYMKTIPQLTITA